MGNQQAETIDLTVPFYDFPQNLGNFFNKSMDKKDVFTKIPIKSHLFSRGYSYLFSRKKAVTVRHTLLEKPFGKK